MPKYVRSRRRKMAALVLKCQLSMSILNVCKQYLCVLSLFTTKTVYLVRIIIIEHVVNALCRNHLENFSRELYI